MAYIIAGLEGINPDGFTQTLALLNAPEPPSDEVLFYSFINDLDEMEEAVLIVLDDYHTISRPVIHKLLTKLIDHPPGIFRFCILSRALPSFPLLKWKVQNKLIEIDRDDLAFTEKEVTQFFQRSEGITLNKGLANTIWTKTEGWVTSLKLIALSARNSQHFNKLNLGIHAEGKLSLDLLSTEIFRNLSASLQDFLLQSSILDQFSVSLCDFVMSRKGSQGQINALQQMNLFIISLDEEQQWFRYHHLFRDMLQGKLKKLTPPGKTSATP